MTSMSRMQMLKESATTFFEYFVFDSEVAKLKRLKQELNSTL